MQRIAVLALALWLGVGPAKAAQYSYVNIPVTPQGGETVQMFALEVLPDGPGRHPLAVINHGTPRNAADAQRMAPGSYRTVATWFADRGFVAVVPMRRGYGQTGGRLVDGNGPCGSPNYARSGLTTANDIEGVVKYMQGQPFVDPKRVVVVGHSAGGWGSIALSSRNPPGVVAVISFAGGRGSYAPDKVCTEGAEVATAGRFGAKARVPSLWIYSENDHFFRPVLAHAMFAAYRGAGAPAEFVAEPPCGQDGHQLINRCPQDWHEVVAAFLKRTVGPN